MEGVLAVGGSARGTLEQGIKQMATDGPAMNAYPSLLLGVPLLVTEGRRVKLLPPRVTRREMVFEG